MNGHVLIPSKSIKYLGIYLDETLSGRFHCQLLQVKLNQSIGMLCKARHYVPHRELISIYYSIFSSHMVYGSQVWGQSNSSHFTKICKLQNRALRVISFSDFEAAADPLYKEYKILKLKNFISLQNCLFVHDFFHNKLPHCFSNYFQVLSEVHSRTTKNLSLDCIFVPHSMTVKYGISSITRHSISCWNNFSTQI